MILKDCQKVKKTDTQGGWTLVDLDKEFEALYQLHLEGVRDTDKLILLVCANCQREKEVDMGRIGAEINQFYKEHRTRIGRTYCHIDFIGINDVREKLKK